MITATLSLVLLAAGWFALRRQEESRRANDLTAYILSIPADEFKGPEQ